MIIHQQIPTKTVFITIVIYFYPNEADTRKRTDIKCRWQYLPSELIAPGRSRYDYHRGRP